MFFQAEEVKELVTQEVVQKCGKTYFRLFTTVAPPKMDKHLFLDRLV